MGGKYSAVFQFWSYPGGPCRILVQKEGHVGAEHRDGGSWHVEQVGSEGGA